ncbi:hypothetical protein MUN89_03630 [Halobacillus salinarum]|uniref:Uncharacterized protein n=1 Tax=Halobacillus salinarum TaxID=2932257 RepID=A0ABY4ESD9_9BACI|nr:hypothetical protein [Halobacillus salinarum]UOQ45056.1 hypothetical protein MUN89_03630 [Halobacillus salinarum]
MRNWIEEVRKHRKKIDEDKSVVKKVRKELEKELAEHLEQVTIRPDRAEKV